MLQEFKSRSNHFCLRKSREISYKEPGRIGSIFINGDEDTPGRDNSTNRGTEMGKGSRLGKGWLAALYELNSTKNDLEVGSFPEPMYRNMT